MALTVDILSPSKKLFSGEASEIVAPSVNGEVGILSQHTEYLTILQKGTLIIKQVGTSQNFNINGGFLKAEKDKITVLVDEVLESSP